MFTFFFGALRLKATYVLIFVRVFAGALEKVSLKIVHISNC